MRNNKNNITLSLQNIISFLKILIGLLTDNKKIITLCFVILMLSLLNIIFNISNISALSYETKTGVSFTINPSLSLSISSSDLVIDNLTPGTTADSNDITINITTNAPYGYKLSTTTSSNDLTNNSNNVYTFNSISPNIKLTNLDNSEDDNIWGYTTKLSNESTWNNYSGLFTGINKTIIDIDDNTSSSVDFKIAAKASPAQPSGTYTNTITFTVIARMSPKVITDLEYLQDFANLDEVNLESVKNSMPIHSTYILKDKRDEQEYTVAKLLDNKIWMTKNLNLAGGTEITSELSDIPEDYTLPTANGFQEGNRLPESSQTGFGNDATAYVYNSNNENCNGSSPCYSYYSWATATANSGTEIATINVDAPYSICPKGWQLPNSRSTIAGNSDFYRLAVAYGMNPKGLSETTNTFYNQAGPNTVPNFLLGGKYENNIFSLGGMFGTYHSSTSYSMNDYFFVLTFGPSNIYTNGSNYRRAGRSLRCLAR